MRWETPSAEEQGNGKRSGAGHEKPPQKSPLNDYMRSHCMGLTLFCQDVRRADIMPASQEGNHEHRRKNENVRRRGPRAGDPAATEVEDPQLGGESCSSGTVAAHPPPDLHAAGAWFPLVLGEPQRFCGGPRPCVEGDSISAARLIRCCARSGKRRRSMLQQPDAAASLSCSSPQPLNFSAASAPPSGWSWCHRLRHPSGSMDPTPEHWRDHAQGTQLDPKDLGGGAGRDSAAATRQLQRTRLGVVAVAVPFFDRCRRWLGLIGVFGPEVRMDAARQSRSPCCCSRSLPGCRKRWDSVAWSAGELPVLARPLHGHAIRNLTQIKIRP